MRAKTGFTCFRFLASSNITYRLHLVRNNSLSTIFPPANSKHSKPQCFWQEDSPQILTLIFLYLLFVVQPASSHVSPHTNKTYKQDNIILTYSTPQLIHYGEESHKGGPLKIKLINEEQTVLREVSGNNNCTHPFLEFRPLPLRI